MRVALASSQQYRSMVRASLRAEHVRAFAGAHRMSVS